MKKIICFLACIILLFPYVSAMTDYPIDSSYESYIYNENKKPVVIPEPYAVSKTVSGYDLGVGALKDVSDIFYDGIDRIYICDAGNNRIIVTDTDYKMIKCITTFNNIRITDSLHSPMGVYANKDVIYVADSENGRIVTFQRKDFSFKKVFSKPIISVLGKNYSYKPIKVAVDSANRLYVIADGINQGIISLDESGIFTSFLGAPRVVPNFLDVIWRKFATKAQKAQMNKYVPTEYNSILIDKDGFVYAASQTSSTSPIAKLNSNGDNILTSITDELGNANPKYGDEEYVDKNGKSVMPYFIDVAVDQNGIYMALDSKQGKIYTYDENGRLLFVFGANGSQKGTFYSASAIEIVDGKVCVTDSANGTITTFTLTQFGNNILQAINFYNQGNYAQSAKIWKVVLTQSSNYTLATIGLAKVDIQNGLYDQAMKRLKPIHEHTYYSKAFEKWRDMIVRNYFAWILLAILVVLIIIPKILRRNKLLQNIKKIDFYQKFKFGTYIMFHPFDGFWDLKREKRGNMKSAIAIFVLFILCFAVRTQFSGYVVTKTISSEVNVLYSCMIVLIPLCLWIIANWCCTTLMSGEGSMKDIIIATSYSLMPYVVFCIPLLILSQILTYNEAMFYTVIDKACIVWVLALLFFGMMITHDYSLSKALLTLVLTIVGICFIIFILLLFINILQEVFSFGLDIYKEISFRSY